MSSPPNSAALILSGDEIIHQYARLLIECLHWNTRYYHTRRAPYDVELELFNARFARAQKSVEEEQVQRDEQLRRERFHASLRARRKVLAKLRREVRRGKIRVSTLRDQLRKEGEAAARLVAPTYHFHRMAWEIAGFPPSFKFSSPLVTADGELQEWAEILDVARARRKGKFFIPLRLLLWYAEAAERCKQVRELTIQQEATMLPGIKQRYLKLRGR